MTKGDLVRQLAGKAKLTQAQAEVALEAFTEIVIHDVFKDGNTISLQGFGTFKQSKSAARMGRNPSTGAVVSIPAKTKLAFKMSAKLG